ITVQHMEAHVCGRDRDRNSTRGTEPCGTESAGCKEQPDTDASEGQAPPAKMSKVDYLGTEKVWKLIIKIGLPSMISFAIGGIYGIVDGIFVGQTVGADALTALSLFYVIESGVINGPLLTIAGGSAPLISRALGAGDKARANMLLTTAFGCALLWCLIVPAVLLPILPRVCSAIGASDTVMPHALAYGRIIVAFEGGSFWLMNCAGPLLRVENRATLSMVRLMISSVLNLSLDALFLMVFDMGAGGAALATVTAQYTVGAFIAYYFASPNSSSQIKLKWKYVRNYDFKQAWTSFVLGSPFLMTLGAASLVQLVINAVLKATNPMADAAQGGLGIAMRVFMLTFYAVVGVQQGMVPIAGYCRGAKKYGRIVKAVRLAVLDCLVLSIILSLACVIWSERIALMFTDDPDTVRYGSLVIRYVLGLSCLYSIMDIAMVLFQIEGQGKRGLLLKAARFVGVQLSLSLLIPFVMQRITSRDFTPDEIFTGMLLLFPVSDIVSGIVSVVVIGKRVRHYRGLVSSVSVCESVPAEVGEGSSEAEMSDMAIDTMESGDAEVSPTASSIVEEEEREGEEEEEDITAPEAETVVGDFSLSTEVKAEDQ
ncbi:multi antimicrobial extrusion protein, partial [Kipferlia bialata]